MVSSESRPGQMLRSRPPRVTSPRIERARFDPREFLTPGLISGVVRAELAPARPRLAYPLAARLRAAAGTLLRAGTTTTAPLPDDVSRSARVVERHGRLVLCDKGFPRFIPEGAGQFGVVHPILPCRIRTAMSRVVARQGEGARVHVTGRIHRYRGIDWLRPDRFQVARVGR